MTFNQLRLTRTKMMEIENFLAVFDMQGFFVDNTFYPREFAVVNNDIKICFEIDCSISNDVKLQSFRQFSYQQHNIHGISLERVIKKNRKVIKIENLKNIIKEIYDEISKENNKNIILIKNQQLAKLLDDYEIPYYNLEYNMIANEGCPTLEMFDKMFGRNNSYCLLHCLLRKSKHVRCSLRKSANIWNWLQQVVSQERFINKFSSLFITQENDEFSKYNKN